MMGQEGSKPIRGLEWRSHTMFIVFAVAMGVFIDLFFYGLIVPVMPFLLQDRLHLPASDIQKITSTLLSIYAAASFISSPTAGALADKVSSSRRIPYVLGLILLLLSTVLFAFGQSVLVLSIARFLQGASGGVVWTLGMTMMVETVGQENLGKTMGTVFGFVSVASLFSPIVGGALYSTSGYKGVFGLCLAMIVVDLVLRLLIVEKKTAAKYTDSHQRILEQETDDQNEGTEATPLLPAGPATPGRYRLSEPQNRFTRTFPIFLLFKDKSLVVAFWSAFVQAALLGAFDATVPIVAYEQFGFNSLKAGLLFLPLGGTDLILGPIFGWAVDIYGTKIPSTIGFAGIASTLVLLRLPLEHNIIEHLDRGHLIALYSIILALNGICLSLINSPSFVEANTVVETYCKANRDLFEQTPYAQLYGINSMIWSAGFTFGPLVAGLLREEIGYGNMNVVLAGICVLTAILTLMYMGRIAEEKDAPDAAADDN